MHNSYQTPSENPTRAFKEKAMAYGTQSLTDAELLAMLLQIPLDSAKEIYHHLLPENKKALFGMSVDEISSLKGMGKSTATKLKGILDFGKRIYESKSTANKKIISSKNAYDHMLPFLIGQEVSLLLCNLYCKNKPADQTGAYFPGRYGRDMLAAK